MAEPSSSSRLVVTLEGYDLPGRNCAPVDAGERYENVHVGVQRGAEVVELVPGDAEDAKWTFEITVRAGPDGTMDFGGPFVHGRRGDRFLYLSWGVVDHRFGMFRRAKLHFADCPAEVLAAALTSGELRCRVRLSDECGNPRCARVRPPDARWTAPHA
jgi:Family of unknown function (DUF5990)